jgi:hypothetical protein
MVVVGAFSLQSHVSQALVQYNLQLFLAVSDQHLQYSCTEVGEHGLDLIITPASMNTEVISTIN